MPGRIITAWRTDTKPPQPVEVPEHWLGHPKLGKNLAAAKPADSPAPDAGENPTTPAAKAPKSPAAGGTVKEQ